MDAVCTAKLPRHTLCVCCTQVMFVMTPGIQQREHHMLDMFLSHSLANANLSKALMKTYIGQMDGHCVVLSGGSFILKY